MGITRQEVERYWKRQEESNKNFTDKFVGAADAVETDGDRVSGGVSEVGQT